MRLLPVHVEAARAVLKMSQADLAEAAGLSKSTILFFEGGQRPLREETLLQIQMTLERRGIEFLNGGSPGVRYHPERDERNKIAAAE